MSDGQNEKEYKEQEAPEVVAETAGNGSDQEEIVREQCEEILALKEEEIKQLQDRVLRLAADSENTRKRLERERKEGICFANESLIRDLLPVVDNLERAVEHGEKEADVETLLSGVRMTLKGFLDTLAKFGCTPFEAVGKPFDPNYHEAVMQQPSSDVPEKTVLQQFQKGYTLHERLVRPALVVVSKAVPEEE